MTKLGADVAARLRAAQIDHADELAALAEPSWRLTATRTSLETVGLGRSRFGGLPDVPSDFAWPSRDGRPLSFLAQLDLAELAVPDLPASGWLLFFYDDVNQPWGFDPKDVDGSRVIHVDAARAVLSRREPPRPGVALFEPCALVSTLVMDLPDVSDRLVEGAGLEVPVEQIDAYVEIATMMSGGEPSISRPEPYHHVRGNPQLVQNDLRGECALVSRGIACGDPSGYQSAEAQVLLAEAHEEWQLLLQLDSDDDGPAWMWGDVGRLYFCIRRTDLVARAFDKVWLVLQCY